MPVKPEHDITSPRAEREFERKAEQEFRGQRELPNGRNFCGTHSGLKAETTSSLIAATMT